MPLSHAVTPAPATPKATGATAVEDPAWHSGWPAHQKIKSQSQFKVMRSIMNDCRGELDAPAAWHRRNL